MFILHLPSFLPRNRISGLLTTVEITGTARAKKARPQRGTIFARYKCATVSSESKPLSFLCTNTAQPAYSSSQICLRKQPPEERETGADPGPAFYLLSTKICKSLAGIPAQARPAPAGMQQQDTPVRSLWRDAPGGAKAGSSRTIMWVMVWPASYIRPDLCWG